MSDKRTFLTVEGKRKLEDELDYLRTVRRPEVARRIHEAKEGGDIMENAGYDAAKDEQAFVEGRIMTLEGLLSQVEIIKHARRDGKVGLGSAVTVVETDGSPETFYIDGRTEADPLKGRISDESPLGRALLGHRTGDRVSVQAPGGTREFEITDVN